MNSKFPGEPKRITLDKYQRLIKQVSFLEVLSFPFINHRTHKKSRNILRGLRDILAQLFIFPKLATFNMRELSRSFFLRDFLQFETLQTKKPLECGLNKRFEANATVIGFFSWYQQIL